jgi:lysophospholipase L1-like esterase
LSADNGENPDIIIVFMGLNDLGRNVDDEFFYADYLYTLLTIKDKYPDAEVFCVNMPDRDESFRIRTLLFNRRIEEAIHVAGENFFLVDLYGSKLNNDVFYMNTLDGLHPDQDGMRMIAEVIKEAMIENAKFKMSHRD